MATWTPDSPLPPPPGTPLDQIIAHAAKQIAGGGAGGSAAPATASTTTAPGVGLKKGEKATGVHQNMVTGTGIENLPGQTSPEERALQLTQYGTPVNAHPYQPADITAPGGDTQDQIINLQNQLIQAGLLNPVGTRAGYWDAKSQAAYKIVLATANQRGMTKEDALTQFLNNPVPSKWLNGPAGTAGSTGSRGYAAQGLTNPADSRAAFDSVAASMTGGGMSQSEQAAFAGQQTSAEQAAVAGQRSAPLDGTYTQAPNPTDAAKQYILTNNPQDVVNYDTALRTVQFHNALGEL